MPRNISIAAAFFPKTKSNRHIAIPGQLFQQKVRTMKGLMLSAICLLAAIGGNAQAVVDSNTIALDSQDIEAADPYPFTLELADRHAINFPSVAIASVGIGYGLIALNNSGPRALNISTKNEIEEDHPHFLTHVDNYLQFSPAAAVFGLNIAGVHGKHTFLDELCIYGVSSVIMLGAVWTIKPTAHEQRPDHSGFNSFPSGHTANAFAAAEWLRTEYWNRSPWIGIAGYAAAAGTGALRVYNNRHWVSDVVAGAAIGFISTRLAYAANPWMEKHILRHRAEREPLTPTTRLEWNYPNTTVSSDGKHTSQ